MTPAILAANDKMNKAREALHDANIEMVNAYTPTIDCLVKNCDWPALNELIVMMPECGYRMRLCAYIQTLISPPKPL